MTSSDKPLIPYAGYEPDNGRWGGVNPSTVLELFRRGLDTSDIALRCKRSEAVIYRVLARERDAEFKRK